MAASPPTQPLPLKVMSLGGTVRRSLSGSIGLARERIQHAPRRVLFTWFLQAIVLLVLGHLLPGVLVEDLFAALIAAAVIAGLNALVRPIIVVLTLPLTVATFGLLSLLINTSMIVLAAPLVPGMEVSGFLPALSLAVILTVATTVVNVMLAVDEDDSFYDELARRIEGDTPTEGPRPAGLVIIQIDGLAAPILRNAIRVGTVPRMASWVRSGSLHADRVGVPAALADVGQPGGHPARQQRRHPGLPLVREGEWAPARLQQARGRHRDRAARLQRPGPAGTGRQQRG